MQTFGIFVFVVCVAAVSADSVQPQVVPIVSSDSDVGIDGTYHYSFETGDGTKQSQQGELKHIDAEHTAEVVHGEVTYTGDDGKTYNLQYTADENGFQPTGEHLPVPPPVPVAIQRALDYLATAPPPKDQPQ